jgi:hypothetical protein
LKGVLVGVSSYEINTGLQMDIGVSGLLSEFGSSFVSKYKSKLEYKIKQISRSVVANEMYKAIVEALEKSMDDNVYGVHKPKYYRRRYDDGGLYDVENFTVDISDDGTVITVGNETKTSRPWPGRTRSEPIDPGERIPLTPLIVDGYGDGQHAWNSPRPYMDLAWEELESSGKLDEIVNDIWQKRIDKAIEDVLDEMLS